MRYAPLFPLHGGSGAFVAVKQARTDALPAACVASPSAAPHVEDTPVALKRRAAQARPCGQMTATGGLIHLWPSEMPLLTATGARALVAVI